MKTLFIETLGQLDAEERQRLTDLLGTLAGEFTVVLLPANVHVSDAVPNGYVFEETEAEEDEKPVTRRLVFPTKADLYDFLTSAAFQKLEADAGE